MKIQNIITKKILNSEGNWSIECTLVMENNTSATASVPQGISTGEKERAIVSPDQAISQIHDEIFPAVKSREIDQRKLDQILEGENWGSNATLAVSAAFFKLTHAPKQPRKLPEIMMLVFEGKKHGNPKLTIQEFMIVINSIEKGIRYHQKVKSWLRAKGFITTVGSEGGFSPASLSDKEILEILKNTGAEKIALDVAANTSPPPLDFLLDIVRRYPIFSLEDPIPETNPKRWKSFFQKAKAINSKILIVADDLTVTDLHKIIKGGKDRLFNAVIIKPNQQGTISQAIRAIKAAKENRIKTIVSHRGQETNDSWIVDLAISSEVDFVKFGAPCRGERVAKYNRLLDYIRA